MLKLQKLELNNSNHIEFNHHLTFTTLSLNRFVSK